MGVLEVEVEVDVEMGVTDVVIVGVVGVADVAEVADDVVCVLVSPTDCDGTLELTLFSDTN